MPGKLQAGDLFEKLTDHLLNFLIIQNLSKERLKNKTELRDMARNRERKINREEKRKNKSWINGKVHKDIQVKNKADKILKNDIIWLYRYKHLKHDKEVTRKKSNKKLIEEVSPRKYKKLQYKKTWSKQNQILSK